MHARSLIDEHFKAFLTHKDSSLEEALREAKSLCGAMASSTEPSRWLTLLGVPGCGKTMLTKLISSFFNKYLDTLPDEHQTTSTTRIYRHGGLKSWSRVINDMREGDYTGLRNLQDDWFLGLDDIGAEYQSRNKDFSISKLYEVLNARLGKFTVINANLTMQKIEEMDDRISSRLIRDGSVVVILDTVDYATR